MFGHLPPIAQLALAIGLIFLARSKKFYELIARNQGDQKAEIMMRLTKSTGYFLLFIAIFVNGIALLFYYKN